ncbi:Site-specific DNA-methyltransferase (adenine-specific) [Paenibacillus nuruki]|uniref:site-specific DNA-methyltransferase (adenine-specific) n=1 Tax=Paenibacillus nuruki TaxID=1886670 RepID=A0A1E3L5P5_9BACL|nr:DNA adenine methylase [Paenibacillus nuruki]ODP28495.1 Site-specific DNA-methyltransferase (adenine-specific) [Paenibacillus nuruki]
MYRYIGNKTKLLPFIMDKVKELIGDSGVVADIMAGTGSVSLELRRQGYSVVASDVMTYSYHHLVVNLLLKESPGFSKIIKKMHSNSNSYEAVLDYLNNLTPKKGYFFNEFSPEGTPENGLDARKYFTSENAAKIDAIREEINNWTNLGYITKNEESLLKHTLIMAVNRVANISGTYGYFLSKFNKSSLEPLRLTSIQFDDTENVNHTILQGFAEELSENITADLCYIDPPYMKRQYAANYHILETVARGDFPTAVGKSGLRNWWDQHSKFCTKTKGLDSFASVISKMNCNLFLISYSEDGLFSLEQLVECFSNLGSVEVQLIEYDRFRSNNSLLPKQLKEYLIILRK